MSFCKDIKDTIGPLLAASGFLASPLKFSKDDFCVYIREVSREIAAYLFFKDGRSMGGHVTASVWIAPKQMPDDSIEVLNIGIKIELYSRYEINDEIIKAIVLKLNTIQPLFVDFSGVIMNELKSPFLKRRRYDFYIYSLNLLSRAHRNECMFLYIKNKTIDCILGRLKYETLKDICTSEIANNPEGFLTSHSLDSLSLQMKGELLAEILFAYLLFPSRLEPNAPTS